MLRRSNEQIELPWPGKVWLGYDTMHVVFLDNYIVICSSCSHWKYFFV